MKDLNETNFIENVKDSTCILDFWAPWCGPCMAVKGVLEEINGDEAQVFKINVDEQENLAARFGVRSIPTLVFMNKGEEVERLVGAKSKDQILEVFNKIKGEG